MSGLSIVELSDRTGVKTVQVRRLVQLGVLAPDEAETFSTGDVRRVRLVETLERAGISADAIAGAIRRGEVSLAFLDQPFYDRFAPFTAVTFQELAARTEIPLELVLVVREAIGFAQPAPEDRVREDELRIVRVVQRLLEVGSRATVVERLLRVWGESMGRIAETEGDWWRTDVEGPLLAKGMSEREMMEAANRLSPELASLQESALLEIYHAHHEHAATKNIVEDIEAALAKAGVHSRLERHPAICFLDITGYTHLTEERGDEAAADLAERLGRLVRQTAARHGGRPFKWLGDGVRLYFSDAPSAVVAALEMVAGVGTVGLPPAHVGVDSGPVLFQEGDYFGRTVNVAARIADYARPAEVLVSQAVVDASQEVTVEFADIGSIELKGVSGAMKLFAARRT